MLRLMLLFNEMLKCSTGSLRRKHVATICEIMYQTLKGERFDASV